MRAVATCEGRCNRKGTNERYYRIHVIGDSAVGSLHKYILVVLMNELVTLEQVQKGIATEEVFELIEDFKTAKERIETLKYQFEELNKKYGVRLWETDYFKMTHIDETESSRVDTKRMKETFFDVVDANTGDVHKVNAYDFFVKKVKVKAHANLEEKK